MIITATEFEANMSKYLCLVTTEDIYITRGGKTIAKLTTPFQERLNMVNLLYGSISSEQSFEEVRAERLHRT